MLYPLVMLLSGLYCGNQKPYIKNMQLDILNETVLDVTVKLPLDTITCNDQYYKMNENEIILEDDCVEKNLKKHKVELEGVYYIDTTNEVHIETNVGDLVLESC